MTTPDALKIALLERNLRIHLIGVAGSGMSGIAGLLLALGHRVSGSDKVDTPEVERLQKHGLDFHCPHRAELVHGVDLVVYSSAIRVGNPAYDETLRLELPRVRRAEVLAAVLHAKKGIVVAGMHGKTTTSAMAAHLLREGGLHPGHYVGAEIPILGANSHWDPHGHHFVAEGDESDGTIRLFHPAHTILLNIEEEHLDFYADLAAIMAAYRTLLQQTSGFFIYCGDNENASSLAAEFDTGISYGARDGVDYRYDRVEAKGGLSQFTLWAKGRELGPFNLGIPGRHNVSNATAAIALALELGVEVDAIARALASFRGAKRRFEEVPTAPSAVRVFDDYGHHPTEITATLGTAEETAPRRILVMFQPHRFSRTQALKDQFASAFSPAAEVRITDIYPANEPPIPGITGEWLARIIRDEGGHLGSGYAPMERIHHDLGNLAQPGDLVISLGAGNIHEAGKKLAGDLRVVAAMQEAISGRPVKLYEPLARYTTMRVGGPAQYFVMPETVDELSRLLQFCRAHDLPHFFLGRGSNLLIRDGGLRGVVIRLAAGDFTALEVEGNEIVAGAGVRFKQVSAAARKAGIGGFEWMEGIPGSVGGSLRMNAGAMGIETFDQVVHLRVMSPQGEVKTVQREEVEARYRETPMLREWVAIEARFRGEPASAESIESLLQASMQKRKTSQPAASSAGCIFQNPAETPAGKLVDELGLKNLTVGQARVSEVHGNFIVNDGGATAADVLQLIERIREVARRERGIELHTEVQVVGETEIRF